MSACIEGLLGCVGLQVIAKEYSTNLMNYTKYGILLGLLGCGAAVSFPLLMRNLNECRYDSVEQTIADIEKVTDTEFDPKTKTFAVVNVEPSMNQTQYVTGLYNSVAASQMRFAKAQVNQ